ncbi:hypothetical protein CSUNSWCD_2387 [Campylobacter showae CSUNSWCD]|uniref:Uncharacterized protein n=1 Tax=Campylobacter showae CSUNSWCD TaxID=1244083 RepID=M5IPW2_9BACT|nr:hypothetical protein CSUNSWCD_2387 [Campylobacter showae CSUNSWCD]
MCYNKLRTNLTSKIGQGNIMEYIWAVIILCVGMAVFWVLKKISM